MAIDARISTLEAKHSELEEQLEALAQSPSASDLDIAEVKRQKLHLKDEIAKLRSQDAA